MSAGALFRQLLNSGKIELTSAGYSDWSSKVTTAVSMTSADFNSATVTPDTTVVFSAEGLYISSNGTWTTNSALGKLLGVASSSKITVTKGDLLAAGLSVPIANTAALQDAVKTYMQTKAADSQYASDIEDPNEEVTLFMGHHASAGSEREGLWTTSGGIATTLDFKSATISFSGVTTFLDLFSGTTTDAKIAGLFLSGSVELGGVALDDTALAAMGNRVIALGVSAGGTIETGLYYISGSTYWTEDLELGRTLVPAMQELRLTLGADINSIINELRPVMSQMINEVRGEGLKDPNPLNLKTGVEFAEGLMSRSRSNTEEWLEGFIDQSKTDNMFSVGDGTAGYFNACSLASAINHNSASAFWAMMDQNDNSILYVFHKDGGDHNDLLACEVTNIDETSRKLTEYVDFEHVENGKWHDSGTTFSLGTTAAQVWGKMKPLQTKESMGNEVWNVTLNGRDVGDERDLWIAAAGELKLPGINPDGGFYDRIINRLDRYSFVELQNAENGTWAGADVRTQSNAQEALDALNYSIDVKDKIRADLGALQNRLENTMTNLEIQAENLQASESRISDVDVAKEMTEFTKNNVLVQAAVGMLAQANSLGQLALPLMR
jgi:flagellin-like hook-associated protein FlgL